MRHFADGLWLAADAPAVPLDDAALQFGCGVFTTLLICDGVPVFLADHLRRLSRDADALAMRCPPMRTVRGRLEQGIRLNAIARGAAKIIISGGVAQLRRARGRPRLYILFEGPRPRPRHVRLLLWPYTPSPWRALKTTAYLDSLFLRRQGMAHGCWDAVATSGGELLEAGTGNIFVVKGGRVLTPRLDGRVLPGITRDRLVAAPVSDIAEVSLVRSHLSGAAEVFLTNCTRGVIPVSTVLDGRGRIVWQNRGARDLTRLYARYWEAAVKADAAISRRPRRSRVRT